jgi:hypothetical protein
MDLAHSSVFDFIDRRTSSAAVRYVAMGVGLLTVCYYFFSTGRFQFPFDDSYITLEFARNFAATGRFTFDGVHAVPGATSPLHVLLLALTARLGVGLEAADAALGILFFLLVIERTGALAWRLTRSRPAVLLSATVTALSGYLVYDSLNGLETTLFIFLALSWVTSVVGFIENRKVTMGTVLWLFLALLTRPEATWLAASVGAYVLLRALRVPNERKALARLLAFLAATGVAAFFTQWALTGSAFPHTPLAKVYLFGDLHRPLGQRLRIFWQGLREVWSPLYFFLLLGIAARRSRVIVWMLLPWLLLTEALFCLLLPGQVATYWGRYQHPLMPFVFVLAGDGFATASSWLASYRTGKVARIVMVGLVAMLCFINLREFRQNLEDDKQVILANHFWAVEWLRKNAPAGARIATHDIGILRYEGGFNIEDLSGLISREAFVRNRAGQGQFEYLAGLRPDYVIGIDFWLDGYLHYYPQLERRCRQVAHAEPRTPTTIRLSIFQCDWEGAGAATAPDVPDSSRR